MQRNTLIKLLNTLNTMLNANNEFMELLIIGGANMCLVQKSRNLTHDIDSYTKSKQLVQKYRVMVSKAMKVDKKWLNDVGDMFVTEMMLTDAYLFTEFSNLKIYSPTDQAMLALKIVSGRDEKVSKDVEDAAFLVKKLGINSIDEVKNIVNYYKPGFWGDWGYEEQYCKKVFEKANTPFLL